MPLDVLRCKYHPETVSETIFMNVGTDVESVVRYNSFDPYVLYLNSIAVDSTKDITIFVSVDGRASIIANNVIASGGLDEPMQFHQLVEKSLVIEAKSNTGGVVANVPIRVNLTVSRYTAYDRIYYGGFVSKREKGEMREVIDKSLIGMLAKMSVQRYLYFREVNKSFAGLGASQNPTIGNIVDSPPLRDADDNKIETEIILLGISCDRALAVGSCQISVTRGESETDYLNLDCRALPGLAFFEDLYVPARDSIEVIFKNQAVASGRIKLRYGVKPLSIRDKLRWDVPLQDFEEDAVLRLKDAGIEVRDMVSLGLL